MPEKKAISKAAPPRVKVRRRNRWTRDDTELTILALPTTIWYILFCYLPMFGVILAFKDYRIIDGQGFLYSVIHSDWIGFENFEYFFGLRQFPIILRNTLCYNIVFIIMGVVLPVALAILISNIYSKRMSKTYQTLMFMPHFMSWVVISYFVLAFLNPTVGLMNTILEWFGADPANWYMDAKYWPYILVFLNFWKTIGYNMVVYLASITGIDQTLYEAAVLDGATKFQQARYITIPSLRPIIIMMFILAVGRIFSTDFGLFYQVTQGANYPLDSVATTFDVQVFKMLQSPTTTMGQTTAASLFQSVIGCITILIANGIVRKVDRASALI